MAQTPLKEISRCKIPINKGSTPFLNWDDSLLTMATEKTVSIFKLTHNLQCMDKKIDWTITDIPCPKTSPATRVFSKKLLKQSNIDNIDYIQMMLNPAYWPHNMQLMEEMASVVSTQWSPPNVVHNNESVIAILNNVGNVELFAPSSCGYSSVLNVSSLIENQLQGNLDDTKKFEDAKKIVDILETSACCWGPEYNDMFYFVTAQKNGDIHFWKLLTTDVGLGMKQLTVQHCDAGEIVTMKWIPTSNDIFLLVVTNMLGQLYVYKYQWENHCPKLIYCDYLWPSKDRMIVRHLKYKIIDGKIVLICNKHRHLLVLLIDDSCNKISEYINNLNDYKITVISETNNTYYIGTVNCKVYKVNITISGTKLNVNVEEKVFKENLVNHDLCGLGFSKNGVICALAVVNRKIRYRKESVMLDIIFLCEEENYGQEIKLLFNPTQSLTDYWDCIELIRCKAMKLKTLPTLDYKQLYANKNSIYENKLYLIFLYYYQSLNNLLKNKSIDWLPETSIEVVKERIFALHAKQLIADFDDICRKKQKNDTLTDFDLETYSAAKKYMKYYCDKYKDTEYSGSDNDEDNFEYTCQCCDDSLKGFSCSNGHINMFCGLTLTPIESSDYLSCSACGLIARKELQMQNPVCLFCDLHLNSYFLPF